MSRRDPGDADPAPDHRQPQLARPHPARRAGRSAGLLTRRSTGTLRPVRDPAPQTRQPHHHDGPVVTSILTDDRTCREGSHGFVTAGISRHSTVAVEPRDAKAIGAGAVATTGRGSTGDRGAPVTEAGHSSPVIDSSPAGPDLNTGPGAVRPGRDAADTNTDVGIGVVIGGAGNTERDPAGRDGEIGAQDALQQQRPARSDGPTGQPGHPPRPGRPPRPAPRSPARPATRGPARPASITLCATACCTRMPRWDLERVATLARDTDNDQTRPRRPDRRRGRTRWPGSAASRDARGQRDE
jgi:hypothetical protein